MQDRLIADGPRIQSWMHDRSGLPIQRDFHGVARERNGELIAAFGYDSFQPHGCQLHLCVDSPTALNRALLFRAFAIPFIQWNFKFLCAIIQEQNTASLNMAKRLGFSGVGLIPGHLRFFAMYKPDCRWIYLAERPTCQAAQRSPRLQT